MKPQFLASKLRPALSLLRCPLCGGQLSLPEQSLLCESGHCFDLTSKGYVNLAPAHDQSAEKYDARLFDSRSAVFADGFYTPVLNALTAVLKSRFGNQPFTLLDAGCGEGYYAKQIAQTFPAACVLGVDLSREAIVSASRGSSPVHWFVADLKRLPAADGAVDAVLDVMTPADYAEFRRILAAGGELIKVVPGADYLCEIRAALAPLLRRRGDYDNARVLDHLALHATVLKRDTIHETYPLTPEQSRHFLRMTPLTFSIPDEALSDLVLPQITLHLEVLRCRML